ncbi:MAG: integrating conjugative element protein, partial [Gammaproteobacteria bacterium]|nr:integrating conjugative element protein [Gammaproteobacteria bacterium]
MTRSIFFTVLSIGLILLLVNSGYAKKTYLKQNLIPGYTGGLYYSIGGGDVAPLPFAPNTTDLVLDVRGNTGLGYNCGVFNPQMSIVNSLNSAKASFERMLTNVITGATGAIEELPAYELAKAQPALYKLMQDGITHGRFDLQMGIKSCQTMVANIDHGDNPYHNWMQASMGDDWKYNMSLAGSSATTMGMLGSSAGDVNQAKRQVSQDQGKHGVPWVQGISRHGQLYAGGQGQPVIHLTRDVVLAGYNVIIGRKRDYGNQSAPPKTPGNKRLLNAFATPMDAVRWIETVVGSQRITTYPGGKKQSIPGIGLLNAVKKQTARVQKKLANLVQGITSISVENLHAVSPPKILLNASVIQTLRQIPNALNRAIVINKVAQEVAVAKVIEQAKLAVQLVEVGSQAPSIFANSAATMGIQQLLTRMHNGITELRNNPKDSQEFVGHTMTTLFA